MLKLGNTKSKKMLIRGLVVLAVFIVFLIFFAALPALRIYGSASKLSSDLKYFKDGIILQNLPQMKTALGRADANVSDLKSSSAFLIWLKVIPFINSYYNDFSAGLDAAESGVNLTSKLLEVIEPVSSYIGISPTGEKKPMSGQDRLAGLTKVAPMLAQNFDLFSDDLKKLEQAVAKINPERYPETFSGKPVRSLIRTAKDAVGGLSEGKEDLKAFLATLPELLGEPTPKNYLVLFQNDKEIRPTGGFWTAYALFRLEKGRIVSIQAGDIYFLDIDNRVPFYPKPPEVISKYLKINNWYIRDTNLSPDYRQSVETFNEFWARVPGVPKTDGVFAIDTYLVADLMGLTGDIKIPNYETFTKDNVVYQLELIASILGSQQEKRGGRKDIIGTLMREMMNKAFALPSNTYDKLIGTVLDLASRKHALAYFKNPVAQELVEKYNFGGRIATYEGDYLHVNDANLGGLKANLYVKQTVSKETRASEKNGRSLTSTVIIDYENTGAWNRDLNTGYRDYVRVYVPKGSELLSSEGSLEIVKSGEELGKTFFSAFIAVDPLKKVRLSFTYKIPEGVYDGKKYKLLIQKQPGTENQTFTVSFNEKKQEFILVGDREVTF